jgi:hypothetical protein
MIRLNCFSSDSHGARALAIVVAVHCLPFAGVAWTQGTGRSLDIQPGARQNGMGAAGVALIGDPSDAVWWNPAALGFARSVSVQGTRSRLLPGLYDDVIYLEGAGAVPVGTLGGIGVGFTHLSYGEQDFGNGPFTPNEISPAASVGLRVFPGLSVGATLKWVRIQLAPKWLSGEATTFGFDLGALYRVPTKPLSWSLGLNIQNLGPSVTFVNADQASPLSRNLKIGGAVGAPMPLGSGFELGGTAVFDFNQSLVANDFYTLNGGVEGYAAYSDASAMKGLELIRLALRLGYYDDPLGDIHDVTFGFGARVLWVTTDVAWLPTPPDANLPRVLKLTGGLHFNLP